MKTGFRIKNGGELIERIKFALCSVIDSTWWQALSGFALGVMASVHPLIWGLLACQVIDITLGVMAAGSDATMERYEKGLKKKCVVWMYVGVGVILRLMIVSMSPDSLVVLTPPIGPIVAGFFITREIASIIKKGAMMGVETPPILDHLLKTVERRVEVISTPGSKPVTISTETTKTVTTEPTQIQEGIVKP